MKSLDYSKNLLIIKFLVPRSDFGYILNVVRSLQGRNFDAVNKQWTALAALNTALAECSDYHLKLELATRRDWKNMEEGK